MAGDSFTRDIARGLGRAYDASRSDTEQIELDAVRLVIFSDHHKGSRDGADDFRRCEPAYNAALAHYFDGGYRLFVLGDVEELWECHPEEVLSAYAHTLALERRFHDAGRYERFFGNHDDLWRSARDVRRHLGPLFPGVRVSEARHLELTDGGRPLGRLFLVHGQQGTADSDKWGWFSRLVVRYIWRPLQRKLNMASTTPSADWSLRQRHEGAMFDWARAHADRIVMVAGHTHRPIFWTSTPEEDLAAEAAATQAELEHERAEPHPRPERVQELHARHEYLRAEERRRTGAARAIDPPCYFNTGCCSYGDGDITGIEIADGEIRLVHWPDAEGAAKPQVLAQAELREILSAVSAATP